MKKRGIGLIIIIVIVALLAVYFTFFFYRSCGDRGCFNDALSECSRVSYLNDAEDASWMYKIQGKSQEQCKIEVKLLALREGNLDLSKLDGKSMTCLHPIGDIRDPQDNLKTCQGELKEEMQDVIINRLHKYIRDNLGEISDELRKVV